MPICLLHFWCSTCVFIKLEKSPTDVSIFPDLPLTTKFISYSKPFSYNMLNQAWNSNFTALASEPKNFIISTMCVLLFGAKSPFCTLQSFSCGFSGLVFPLSCLSQCFVTHRQWESLSSPWTGYAQCLSNGTHFPVWALNHPLLPPCSWAPLLWLKVACLGLQCNAADWSILSCF